MHTVISQNGLAPGGLNFDCKIRRESSDLEDLFIGHIAAMDNLAFALKKAAQVYGEKLLSSMLEQRYASFKSSDLGKKVETGSVSVADCEAYLKAHGEPKPKSAKQEKFEQVFNNYFI